MTVTKSMLEETGTQAEDLDGMINYARRIEDVKMAALIQEQKNGSDESNNFRRYHVSLRSDSTVDVAAIASLYKIQFKQEAVLINSVTTAPILV